MVNNRFFINLIWGHFSKITFHKNKLLKFENIWLQSFKICSILLKNSKKMRFLSLLLIKIVNHFLGQLSIHSINIFVYISCSLYAGEAYLHEIMVLFIHYNYIQILQTATKLSIIKVSALLKMVPISNYLNFITRSCISYLKDACLVQNCKISEKCTVH